MSVLSRRGFLAGAACFASGIGAVRSSSPATYSAALAAPAEPVTGGGVAAHFVAAEREIALPCFGGNSLPMWTFSEERWLPVIRMNLGDRLETVLDNRLSREDEHTSIHWHGIRLPNDQDGVPYLVQQPVFPGERYRVGCSIRMPLLLLRITMLLKTAFRMVPSAGHPTRMP